MAKNGAVLEAIDFVLNQVHYTYSMTNHVSSIVNSRLNVTHIADWPFSVFSSFLSKKVNRWDYS